MKALSQAAIHGDLILWRFDGSKAAKPIGLGAEAITIIVDKSVFSRKPVLNFVKLGSSARRDKECLEKGDLAVLIQIGIGVCDFFGEILAKPREILFIAAACGRDDDPVGSGQLV